MSNFSEGTVDPAEIEDLFEQLEDLSDSGPDVDTISIGSTPKPSLKPFFNSSRSLLQQQQQQQQHSECFDIFLKSAAETFFASVIRDSFVFLLLYPRLQVPRSSK